MRYEFEKLCWGSTQTDAALAQNLLHQKISVKLRCIKNELSSMAPGQGLKFRGCVEGNAVGRNWNDRRKLASPPKLLSKIAFFILLHFVPEEGVIITIIYLTLLLKHSYVTIKSIEANLS